MVWYKPNAHGSSGWFVESSINYRLFQYLNGLVNRSIKMPDKVDTLVQSFKISLKEPVEILVAFDTSLNIGLIVDGR